MTPWKKEKLVVTTAEWMWWNQDRNRRDIWWIPSDLTNDNPDSTNPHLALEDAQIVFEELKNRGLLRIGRIEFFREVDEHEESHQMVVYFIQRHRETVWKNLKNKGWWGINIAPLFKGKLAIILSVGLFAFGAVFGGFFSEFGKDLHDFLIHSRSESMDVQDSKQCTSPMDENSTPKDLRTD